MGGGGLNSRVKRGAKGGDFGDPRLTNVELAPVPEEQRRLRFTDLAILWTAVGVGPATYAVACGVLPWRGALAALSLASLLTALLGVALSFTAARYGVGFVALARAALGARGALAAVALRFVVGVGFLAVWSADIGGWVSRLLVVIFPTAAVLGERWMQRGVTWLCAALLLVVAWLVTRGGLSRIRRTTGTGLVLAICIGFGLVVWAGIASRGFGAWLARESPLTLGDVGRGVAQAIVPLLCGLAACTDWERFRVFRGKGRADWQTRLAVLAPLGLVPVAVMLAFLGALLASASDAVRGSLAAAPIPDAAGFGGIGAGLLAIGLAGMLWVVAAPLVGFYSSALAVCGLAPRRAGYLGGLNVTLVAALVTSVVAEIVPAGGRFLAVLPGALAAVIGILVVDELVVRRGRVLLEELFLFGRSYGPWLGVCGGGALALLVGWGLHPELLANLASRLQPSLTPGSALAAVWGWGAPTLGIFGGGLVAAAVYLAVAPLERWLVNRGNEVGEPRAEKRQPAMLDGAPPADVTNPDWSRPDKS